MENSLKNVIFLEIRENPWFFNDFLMIFIHFLLIFNDFLVFFSWFCKHLEISLKKGDFLRNSVSPAREPFFRGSAALKNRLKSLNF